MSGSPGPGQSQERRASTGPAARRLERFAAAWLLVLALFFTFRTPAWGLYDPPATGLLPGLIYGGAAAILILCLRWGTVRRTTPIGQTALAAVVVLMGLFSMLAVQRIVFSRITAASQFSWPPRIDRLAAVVLDSLSSTDQASWAAHVASHRLLDEGRVVLPISIPVEWPFPSSIALGTRRVESDEIEVWARAGDGTAVCLPVLLRSDLRADSASRKTRCVDQHEGPSEVTFAAPDRDTGPQPRSTSIGRRSPWPQYRFDAAHTAIAGRSHVGTDSAQAGWITTIDGRIRASVSVSDDLVMVGGHGTGSFTVLDARTGEVHWIARAPNWIHQDPVTDGNVVVVGFGDNTDSFSGRAPSGVAAYELETGRHLWTAFDGGSVMTTAVLRDSMVVYASGVGLVRKRNLFTGALEAIDTLPGGVIMAPPMLVGDTIVFTLEPDHVCALLFSTMERRWCRRIADLRMMGHAAPAAFEGLVVVSGVGSFSSASLAEYRRMNRALQSRLLRSALFPGQVEVHSGQVFLALGLHDGSIRWRSHLYGDPRLVPGHTAGTATFGDATGVIVLPVSDSVVAFDPETGAVHWASGANGARAAPLILGDRVLTAGRNGVIEMRKLADGSLTCAIRRRVGWDRAGPAVAGDLVIFANLDGEIEAIPTRELLECTVPGSQRPAGAQ